MIKRKFLLFIVFLFVLLLLSSYVHAQFPVVSADQVKQWLDSGRRFALIDSRLPAEYVQGHIPGAINIPAERMKTERSKLPKDKSILLVFYCRGVG